MLVLIFGEDDKEGIEKVMVFTKKQFPDLHSLNYQVNTKWNDSTFDIDAINYSGEECIYEELEDLRFRISPKSFFQTNSAQGLELYKLVRDYAKLKGTERVLDLYTGTGSIALFLARHAKEVIGIETIEEAIIDARKNAELNGITNSSFYVGEVRKVMSPEFVEKHGKPDLIVTDPPRAGMHKDVVEQLKAIGASRIIYVSCNSATQARDLELLADQYKVVRSRAVDLFPHTAHVENVVELKLLP
jgi:23S rRNA (uracil1939-C5)-methyltransferase